VRCGSVERKVLVRGTVGRSGARTSELPAVAKSEPHEPHGEENGDSSHQSGRSIGHIGKIIFGSCGEHHPASIILNSRSRPDGDHQEESTDNQHHTLRSIHTLISGDRRAGSP
jgi:hypothetical protein